MVDKTRYKVHPLLAGTPEPACIVPKDFTPKPHLKAGDTVVPSIVESFAAKKPLPRLPEEITIPESPSEPIPPPVVRRKAKPTNP